VCWAWQLGTHILQVAKCTAHMTQRHTGVLGSQLDIRRWENAPLHEKQDDVILLTAYTAIQPTK
jgi:hypothetical protein